MESLYLEENDEAFLPYREGLTAHHNDSWVIKKARVMEPVGEDGRLRIEYVQQLKQTSKVGAEELFTREEVEKVMEAADPPIEFDFESFAEPNSDAVKALALAVEARRAKQS